MKANQDSPSLVISIVSHGQGSLIRDLLCDLETLDFGSLFLEKIVITLNLPESEGFFDNTVLPIEIKRNKTRKGFGCNHNAALHGEPADFYCVINPDIRIPRKFQFDCLADVVRSDRGVVAPAVFSEPGVIEDSARDFPTLISVLFRSVRRILKVKSNHSPRTNLSPDWVAGMFMFFDRDSFISIGGFDEGFFMYLEDTDICRRLRLAGCRVTYLDKVWVQHDARRNSLKSLEHFRWHCTSLVRFWLRSCYSKIKSLPDGIFKLWKV